MRRSGFLMFVNFIGWVLRLLKVDPFKITLSEVLTNAKKQSGYDYNNESMREGLEKLIHSLEHEANLDTFGKLSLKTQINRAAVGRFQVEKAIHEHPHILKQPIKSPIFIIGMPRTGTTILHALLACDSASRSPLAWECLLPYPVSAPETYHNNSQITKIRKEFEILFALVPDFKKKHYMEAHSPQECIGIDALHFTSFQYLAQCYMPHYHEWLVSQANTLETMRWHKRFLQYLQSGGVASQRWLLKTPIHLMRLEQLFEVYPDAKVVMSHRHPNSVVPSAASLMSSMRSLYSKKEDPLRTGQENLVLWSDYINRFNEARGKLGKEDQIIDVLFEDFVSDHIGVVESIYDKFGLRFTDAAREKMQVFLDNEPKDKHGKHVYSLEQFNLTDDDIRRVYSDYLSILADLQSNPLKEQHGK